MEPGQHRDEDSYSKYLYICAMKPVGSRTNVPRKDLKRQKTSLLLASVVKKKSIPCKRTQLQQN